MSLEEQQKRYIQLNGDPIHMQFNQAVLHRATTKAAGLAAIFNLAVVGHGQPSAIVTSLVIGASAYVLVSGIKQFSDWIDNREFSRDYKNLSIDKTPAPSTPPTSPDHLKHAKYLRGKHFALTGLGGLHAAQGLAVGLVAMYYVDEPLPLDIVAAYSFANTGAMVATAHFSDTFYRLNKIVKGEWIITDLPKPEKQEEKVNTYNAVPNLG